MRCSWQVQIDEIIKLLNQQNYSYKPQSKLITSMSTLPQMFRTSYSSYIPPTKQGGIFKIKYQSTHVQSYATIQPQQFSSVKLSKFTESRVGTSHTLRSKKIVSFADDDSRPMTSSQSQRKVASRRGYSRDSTRQIRKDIFNNYGNSRVSFAIGQPVQANSEEAESLLHTLNHNSQQIQKCQAQFFQIIKQRCEIHGSLLRMKESYQQQLKQINKHAQSQFVRLRQVLSDLRRKSGMETKVNKSEISEVQSGYKTIAAVMDQMDDVSAQLYGVCIR